MKWSPGGCNTCCDCPVVVSCANVGGYFEYSVSGATTAELIITCDGEAPEITEVVLTGGAASGSIVGRAYCTFCIKGYSATCERECCVSFSCESFTVAACECIHTADDTAPSSFADASVTVSLSTTPRSHPLFPGASISCTDFSGTYYVPICETYCYYSHNYVGTSGGNDYYYLSLLRINHQEAQIDVDYFSKTVTYTAGTSVPSGIVLEMPNGTNGCSGIQSDRKSGIRSSANRSGTITRCSGPTAKDCNVAWGAVSYYGFSDSGSQSCAPTSSSALVVTLA